MNRFAVRLAAAWLMLASAAVVNAVIVEDLYEAEVAVADHSAAARAAAARDALSRVFIKVSGSSRVLAYEGIIAALERAPSYLQQYHYSGDASVTGEISIRMEFDAGTVNDLVTGAGAPLWTANRPPVLAWVVIDSADGRQFLTPDTLPEVSAQLQRAFRDRGLALQLPLFDLQDAAALGVDEAWRLDGGSLANASARYGATDILAGRFTRLSAGDWLGEWSFMSAAGRIDRSVTAENALELTGAGAGIVAEEMALRYAIAPTRTPLGGVILRIHGVHQYRDYASIVSHLEQIELVEHANVAAVSGNAIVVRLVAQAAAEQLGAVIELDRRLVPLDIPRRGAHLVYQWQE